MGFDVYCAICGGPLHPPDWEAEEQGEALECPKGSDKGSPGEQECLWGYDGAIVRQQSDSLNWLSDVRMIGENVDCSSPVKVWVSGKASEDDLGWFGVEPGDDPNFFAGGRRNIPAYKQGHDIPIAFPFHHDCQTILREHLGVDEFDKEVLYETLNGLFRDGEDPTSLEINYGAATEFQEQYWVVYHGFEYLVFSPLNIPQLMEYYGSLPKRVPQKVGTEDDREVSNTSWKMRLMGDMPWLYDFPKPSSAEAESIVDWERVYRELYVASDATSKDKIQGLANRRRIWEEQCPQICSKYLATKMKRDLTRNRVPLPLKDASSIQSPSLILPSPKSTEVTIAAFIHSYEAISYVDPVVVVCWTANGDLAGLDVRQSDGLVGTTNISGPNDTPNKFDGVLIPRDDWLTGIIVTSKEDSCNTQDGQIRRRIVGVHLLFTKQDPIQLGVTEGDQRLIYVSDAHFVVGFKVFRSLDGTMSAFALLQQPTTKALGVERIANRNSDSHNLDAMKYLWRQKIPPPKLQISDFLSGYWPFDMKVDTSPMEALIFGATEDEMADITAFSVDVHFGGFEIEYGSCPTRTIGPRREVLRTLRIDGSRGERIIAVYFCVYHLPTSMRLVTNRGRQLVLGQPTDWNETRLPPTSGRGDVCSLSGIYGWWSGQHPTDDLKAVGCLFSPPGAISQANKLPDRSPRDSHGLYWDPSAYPADIIESGQIVPLNSRSPIFPEGTVHMPGQVGTVSWLDCSRPLAEVCVISYRQTTQDQLSLLGITFVYADKDSEEVAAGLGRFRLSVSDTEEVHMACRCAVTDTLTPGLQIAQVQARESTHYLQQRWVVGGRLLRSFHMWQSESGDLLAMQMTAAGGSTSPIWGTLSHGRVEPSTEIQFEDQGSTMGIKLFFNSNGLLAPHNDTIIVAIQALKRISNPPPGS